MEPAYILSRWPIPVLVMELAVNPHLVDLLQTQRVVPQVRLAEAPSVGEHQVLQLGADLAEAVVDGLERGCDVLGLLLRLDLLRDLEAFLEERRADCLGCGDHAAGAEELPVHALRVDLAQLLLDRLELGLVRPLFGGERDQLPPRRHQLLVYGDQLHGEHGQRVLQR